MKKHSKLLLSQTAVALPVAFSATTYQINETLTVDRLTSGDDDVYSSLYFDISTGAYELDNETVNNISEANFDLAISLVRIINGGDSSQSYTKGKAKSNSGNGTGSLKAKSSTIINDNTTLDPLGTNGVPFAPNFKAEVNQDSTTLTTDYQAKISDYMGVKAGFYSFFGAGFTNQTETAGVDMVNTHLVSGSNTQYLGFVQGTVELFAKLRFDYLGTDHFADSITIDSIVVGDPGEDLITYVDFVPVPEGKQTAALVGLLAGSAALYSRRRKKA